jgi:hypothetical protein
MLRNTVKVSLRRLRKKDLIHHVRVCPGYKGGASYRVSKLAQKALAAASPEHEGRGTEGSPESPVVGSRIYNDSYLPTSTNISMHKSIAVKLDTLLTRYDLGEPPYKIAGSDLLSIWQEDVFGEDLQAFLESVEHAAFYLKSDQANGIKHPKAWMMKKLRSGYFAPPTDYVSWEQRVAEDRLKAAQQKLQRMRELEETQFDTDFEIWFKERSQEERRELLRGSFFKNPDSQAARVVLRQKFCEQTGRQNPHSEREEEESR